MSEVAVLDLDSLGSMSAEEAVAKLCEMVEGGVGPLELGAACVEWLRTSTPEKFEANCAWLIGSLLRLVQLKEMPYWEYLQSPEWQRTAAAAKERYGNTCALDARHPAEDAHHRTYSRLGRERPEDVVPLCHACHGKHHGK